MLIPGLPTCEYLSIDRPFLKIQPGLTQRWHEQMFLSESPSYRSVRSRIGPSRYATKKPPTPHYKVFLSDGVTPCPPDLLPLVRALHGESVQMEMMVERSESGNGVLLEVTARPLKGNLGGGVAVLRDITERKAAEWEIQALNQSLHGASRMGEMVDEMLKLARTSRQALQVERTGLSSLVEDVVTLFSPEIEGRQVQWKIGELPFVE